MRPPSITGIVRFRTNGIGVRIRREQILSPELAELARKQRGVRETLSACQVRLESYFTRPAGVAPLRLAARVRNAAASAWKRARRAQLSDLGPLCRCQSRLRPRSQDLGSRDGVAN